MEDQIVELTNASAIYIFMTIFHLLSSFTLAKSASKTMEKMPATATVAVLA
jgi:hypothetical protein